MRYIHTVCVAEECRTVSGAQQVHRDPSSVLRYRRDESALLPTPCLTNFQQIYSQLLATVTSVHTQWFTQNGTGLPA